MKRMSGLGREDRVPAITPEEFYNRVADADPRPVPAVLREASTYEGDNFEVPVERFISREYQALEVEKLWKRVWQMACREEEIPEVGDIYLYEVATLQFIVVRTAHDTIKAYPNSCLHRGRQLVDCNKRATQIRCPFHGFTWNLDGSIAAIPCAWEFSHVPDPAQWQLPEAKVGIWGGFVFINPDPEAGSLQDYLGDIDRHYTKYPLEDRYISGHARKVVPCNWKVAQEAFLEAYHVFGTHPQLVPQGSHTDMKYDTYGNYSRTVGVNYIQNAFSGFEMDDQEMLDSIVDLRMDQERKVVAKDGQTVRQRMAEMARAGISKATGKSSDEFSDSELIDICFMSIFPNIHPWTLFTRICYHFRPYKDDPDKAWMDVYQLMPFDASAERPAPAEAHFLTDEEDWTAAPEVGVFLARISNQDMFNFAPIQQGMKASATRVLRYSRYQESRIRHFHKLLDDWVGK
ncbi:MAG: iron-sulfur protein [Bradyrhizobium sp.]|nr:iron-sulfur protein [Bradyrhizobium sp.]